MPLPIIILLERHWDTVPKQALMGALPFLNASGYNTLCIESPCDKNEQETIASFEDTVKFIEERLTEADECLVAKYGINIDLIALDYFPLQQLLRNYVSSRYFKEMALWFKELPGHKEKLAMAKIAVEKNMSLLGIDLTTAELEPINSLEAQTNLSSRVSSIGKLDKARTLAFKKNMLKLQQQGKGVIFVVGQSHYSSLLEEFSKEYYLGDVIFLHPYSSRCLNRSYIDYDLAPSLASKDLVLVEKKIDSNDDVEKFLTDLKAKIVTMLSNCVSIEPTSTCQTLSKKTNLSFEAYIRPSYLVDCYHFFKDRENITNTMNQLNDKGVRGFFTFFNNKPAYCVPSINTQEMASQVLKLDL